MNFFKTFSPKFGKTPMIDEQKTVAMPTAECFRSTNNSEISREIALRKTALRKKSESKLNKFQLLRPHKREFKAAFDLLSLRMPSKIAHGSFGVIAIGKSSQKRGEQFAIKIIVPKYDDQDYRVITWRRQAHREAYLLGACRHENIVKFYASHMIHQRTEGSISPIMFAMKCELMDGDIKSLFTNAIAENEEQRFRLLARQIGSAIEYCHMRCIVHHDIKMANILYKKLPGQNEIIFKLTDFGISRPYARRSPDLPLEREHYPGTYCYFCPEKERGVPYNPYKADVYAFGLTLARCKLTNGFSDVSPVAIYYKTMFMDEYSRKSSSMPYFDAIRNMLNSEENDRPYMIEVLHFFE